MYNWFSGAEVSLSTVDFRGKPNRIACEPVWAYWTSYSAEENLSWIVSFNYVLK